MAMLRADGDFDILSDIGGKKSDRFRITFDFHTPRSKFPVLLKQGHWHDWSNLSSSYKRTLVDKVRLLEKEFHLSKRKDDIPTIGVPVVLSIPRGSWINTEACTQGYICTGLDTYCDVFAAVEPQLPNWPSRRYVTKNWTTLGLYKDPWRYIENVREYKNKACKDTDNKEMKELRKVNIFCSVAKEDKYRIVHHDCLPRIGFLLQEVNKGVPSSESILNLLEVMEDFGQKHELCKKKKSNEKNMLDKVLSMLVSQTGNEEHGCHLVVNLSEKSFSGFEKEEVYVYIQLSGACFYQLCPIDQREQWYQRFCQTDSEDTRIFT